MRCGRSSRDFPRGELAAIERGELEVLSRAPMRRYEQRVTVTADREVVVRLPSDFPPGEAHVIVHTAAAAPVRSPADLVQWLDDWIALPPKVPHIQLETIDRDDIYR